MNCYNHPEQAGLAICKNCNKALCKDCLTELDDGIACTATCVEKVQEINSLIDRNSSSQKSYSSTALSAIILYTIMGISFVYYGLRERDILNFLLIIGLAFLAYSFNLFVSWRKRNQ